MSYLQNPICKFKPLFRFKSPEKGGERKNIVSSSLFRLYGGGYKQFSKYIDNIKHVNRFIVEEMKIFKHRLFIDESVYRDKDSMMKLRKLDIELVLYTCPDYMIGKKYHKGTFGTLVRFFPMFNFPGNDARYVFMTDVDYSTYESVMEGPFGRTFDLFKRLVENNILDKVDYGIDVTKFKQDNFFNHIIANKQFVLKLLDRNMLVDFFQNINTYKERLSYYPVKKNNIDKTSGKFIYGVDEWFINNLLFPDLIENKTRIAVQVKNYITGYIILNMLRFSDKEKKSSKIYKEYISFFKWVYPDKNIKNIHKGARLMLKQSSTWWDTVENYDLKVILRTYEYFIYVYGTKKEDYYGKEYLDHVLSEEYIGVYLYKELRFINTNIKILSVEKKTLPLSDINYLKGLMGYI